MKIIQVFWVLLACNLICNIAQSIISPFYPNFAHKRGVSEEMIGMIFSAQPIGIFIASLIIGKIITQQNRSIIMNSGIIVQGLGLLLFAFLYFVDNYTLFITISLFARLFGGMGAAFFMTPFYAYIPLLFPDSVEQKIAVAEIFTAVGFLIGPIFGSLLFSLGGFIMPFMFFSCISFILGIIMIYNKGSLVQDQVQDQDDLDNLQPLNRTLSESNLEEFQTIPYLEIIFKYPIFISYILIATINAVWNFQYPILSPYLESQYHVNPSNTGYFVSFQAIAYSATAYVVSIIRENRKFYIYFGFIMTGYITFNLGPDPLFSPFKPSLWLTFSMWTLIGPTSVFPYILAVPQLNAILLRYYPNKNIQCANTASALFNSGLALGGFFGPIAGGILTDKYGYARATSCYGLFVLLVGILYTPFLFQTRIRPIREVKQILSQENRINY